MEQQQFYVVLSASKNREALDALLPQTEEAGLRGKVSAPRSGKEQSALVVAQGESSSFLASPAEVEGWEAIAQTLQANAYAVLAGRAFFDCEL